MYSTTIFFFILAGCAVKSDDASNYFVVQMPDEVFQKETQNKKTLQVYWNVPTVQCKSKQIPFEKLHDRYGIIQNKLDSFRGDKVAIMYDPGYFPAIFKNASSGELVLRNGGVPQEGDLELHMEQFKKDVEHQIEDPNFEGVGIIDFESWRPIFRQNFGTLEPYQKLSCDIERKKHWWWPNEWIKAEATKRFEEAARGFMQNTISIAKQLRPKARWGYYGFPYCFNNAPYVAACAKLMPEENDRLYWLWSESTALFPSIYSPASLTAPKLSAFIKARVGEASRLARGDTPVLPYWWFRYRDAGYFTETDLSMALQTLYRSSASGFIIWGSSSDVNTPDKCHDLLKYIENVLGPSISKYTRSDSKVEELNDTEMYNDDGNVTFSLFVEISKRFGADNATKNLSSTSQNETNLNGDKTEVEMTTRHDFNTSSVGEISVLTSTTEMGVYANEDKVYRRTTEEIITNSPIIRILSTINDKNVTTSLPTEEKVLAKELSIEKEDLSTTVKIDYTTQSTTFTTEDYDETNITNVENDEIFFNEEDFFDDSAILSDDDIATSTVQSTTDNNRISTDTKAQNTQDTENTENSFVSTTTTSHFSDEKSTVLSFENDSANKDKSTTDIYEDSVIRLATNHFNITVVTVEIKPESLDKQQDSITESIFDNVTQNQESTTFLHKSSETTTPERDQTVSVSLDKVTESIKSTEVTEKTKIKQNWRKTLFTEDEETNETFEDNETMLKSDPTSMGLSSGEEKVFI